MISERIARSPPGQPLIAHIGLQSRGFIPARPQGRVILQVSAARLRSLPGLLGRDLRIDFIKQLGETFIGPSLLFEGQALFYVIP